MNKLKVAVIGLGNMGQYHARNYAQLPEVELVAVCDSNAERAEALAAETESKAYTDWIHCLEEAKPDAVSLVTPTATHFDMAKQLIERGIHCLIEKPIAQEIHEADQLIALSKEKNVQIAVGHIERFNPAITALKQCIDQGRCGDIRTISTFRAGPFPTQIKDANVVIDLAVHDIDIVSYLSGKSPIAVTANTGKAFCADRPDHAEILLNYQHGLSATVHVNWITPKRVRTLTLTGTKAYAELDYIAQTLTLTPTEANTDVDEHGQQQISLAASEAEQIDTEQTQSLKEELRHFIACIQNQEPCIISAEIGKQALAIALKANI